MAVVALSSTGQIYVAFALTIAQWQFLQPLTHYSNFPSPLQPYCCAGQRPTVGLKTGFSQFNRFFDWTHRYQRSLTASHASKYCCQLYRIYGTPTNGFTPPACDSDFLPDEDNLFHHFIIQDQRFPLFTSKVINQVEKNLKLPEMLWDVRIGWFWF